ncbi:CDP-alcohol phosphatidyltransferase family protein [Candidatus Parcubacteria bacterium]|nr:MAG: CDP-alcohol phosphatidyltransferase family protein [Candidatus Parcubacteria bacterium]
MNFEDFKKKAQAGKEDKISSSGLMYRWQRFLSVRISWLLIKIFPNIKPNHISVFNILLTLFVFVLSFFAWDLGPFYMIIIQLLLLNFTSVLDKVDGEIARHKEIFTQQGVYYDLTYHFFYPFVFYFAVGYFWFLSTVEISILLFSIFLAILAMNSKMLGKLRHHVKYKVELESHGKIVSGLLADKKNKDKKPAFIKLINYLVFLIYDWTWNFYFVLIIWSLFNFKTAIFIYFMHLVLSIILIIKQIFFDHPRHGLYSKEDFN